MEEKPQHPSEEAKALMTVFILLRLIAGKLTVISDTARKPKHPEVFAQIGKSIKDVEWIAPLDT